MNVLLLGATGRTGKHLLEQALHRGHTVHVLVRDKNKLTLAHSLLHVFEGTPADINALEKAMTGCEAVLSALNISRTSDFPWAPLRTPKNFLSDFMNKLIAVCNKLGCRRVIILSAWGVKDTRNEIPGWFRWFIDHSNIRYPYLDHAEQEELLRATSLDWTILRPAGLTNSGKEKKVITSLNAVPKPGLLISRRNLAKYMLNVLENGLHIRETPTLST